MLFCPLRGKQRNRELKNLLDKWPMVSVSYMAYTLPDPPYDGRQLFVIFHHHGRCSTVPFFNASIVPLNGTANFLRDLGPRLLSIPIELPIFPLSMRGR